MKIKTCKWLTSVVVAIGILTGIQGGHHSFYEGHLTKLDLAKKLSGHEGQWTKEKRDK